MSLVVLAGASSLLIVALLVAPQLFQSHLRMALPDLSAPTLDHVDRAFAYAVLLSLGMAVVVASAAALAVTYLVSRRIAAPVAELAVAAERVAAGQYQTRVANPQLGPEFAAVAEGFNSMAARLASTEQLRQQLLADLAHELRTPVASIEATVEAVADGVLPADQTSWATLTDQTARLARLLDDLSSVSRVEERGVVLEAQSKDLGGIVATAVSGARARFAAKRVSLDLVLSNPVRARVDTSRLVEALTNLLDNALRHTAAGGAVTVTVERGQRLGMTVAEIAVADTGDGFEPTDAERIFERFYRGDSARVRAATNEVGSGIGLTISRAIIRAHQGTIHARSVGRGHGATFEITLPEYDA
jgi:signal transduction histidine kinase